MTHQEHAMHLLTTHRKADGYWYWVINDPYQAVVSRECYSRRDDCLTSGRRAMRSHKMNAITIREE